MGLVKGICPECGKLIELPMYETIKQRWDDCFDMVNKDERYIDLELPQRVQIAINFFNEINDFIISEQIANQKKEMASQIQKYKKDNIKEINK